MNEYLYELQDTVLPNLVKRDEEMIYQNATKRLHRNRKSDSNNFNLITPESEDISDYE